jgi:hypothetical protein
MVMIKPHSNLRRDWSLIVILAIVLLSLIHI